jgi:hypothetical protein
MARRAITNIEGKTMNLTEIKNLKTFCESLHSTPDYREVIEELQKNPNDFEVNNVRFIRSDEIQEILEEELSSDLYILGCFTASAIAEATGWPLVLVEAAQKGEAFEAIGEAMTEENISNLASIYASVDGYGHHFNHYDFGEEEITIDGVDYLVFDNH